VSAKICIGGTEAGHGRPEFWKTGVMNLVLQSIKTYNWPKLANLGLQLILNGIR
jgi:hypothetical protein